MGLTARAAPRPSLANPAPRKQDEVAIECWLVAVSCSRTNAQCDREAYSIASRPALAPWRNCCSTRNVGQLRAMGIAEGESARPRGELAVNRVAAGRSEVEEPGSSGAITSAPHSLGAPASQVKYFRNALLGVRNSA